MVEESFARTVETKDLLDRFELYLATQSEPWGKPVQARDGSMRRRSLAWVFRLMRNNAEPKEIAKELHVTPGSVFGYINKIKAFADQFKISHMAL
jgi:hypothetical protein